MTRSGYFKDFEDGFGPVMDNHDDLIENLRQCLNAGGRREEIYEQRAKDFFTLQDGKNCSRTFDAIIERS